MVAFKWVTEVGDVDIASGGSTTFGVTVLTDLPEYEAHGEPLKPPSEAPPTERGDEGGGGAGGGSAAANDASSGDDEGELVDALSTLTLIPERRIRVRRTYSAFVQLRDALTKAGFQLPELPGKSYFSSTDAKTIEARRVAFSKLLEAIGNDQASACADATCAWLSDVAKPDYAKTHASALQRMHEVLALPSQNWEVRYSKRDIEIAVQRVEASQLYLIRSSVLVPLPVERTHALYTHTPNWQRWTPDAVFSEVERLSASAAVLSCVYRLPVISNRDVCFYEAALQTEELAALPASAGASAPGCRGAVALSVQHPHSPVRRNVVRARLLIAVTLFTPAPQGSGTVITSIQHADPRGIIPASVINACLARGKTQLKEMRRVMVEMG